MRIELRYVVVAVVLAAACNNKPVLELRKAVREARRGPQVQATVVTIRTTLQPANKATTTTVIIADDLARSMEEVGEWRLFDLRENRVAFVNDFAKTYRYESLESMRERHSDAWTEPLSDKVPRVEYSSTSARRDILGVVATQSIVKLGAYRREIWVGSHPLIPPQLFALMQASHPPGPDAPVSRPLDEALLSLRGFPLADHAELPYAQTKIVVDRDVVSIVRKNVTASLLDIPETYREARPAPPPAPKPKPVAPPPHPVPPPAATTATVAPPPAVTPPATATATVAPTATTPAATETFGPPKPTVKQRKKAGVTKKPAAKKKATKTTKATKATKTTKTTKKPLPAKTTKSSTKKSS